MILNLNKMSEYFYLANLEIPLQPEKKLLLHQRGTFTKCQELYIEVKINKNKL